MGKIAISLSGGMDSTALVGSALHKGHKVIPVSFTYGSKHNQYENLAAEKVAAYYGLELIKINMESTFAGFTSNLLKSGGEIPEGHYAEESMKATVVPNRNLIFISVLAGLAVSKGCSVVAIGVHSGDHAIYPDCRPDFVASARATLHLATDGAIADLWAPFLYADKTAIIRDSLLIAKEGGPEVPFGLTRTCYKDQPFSCGKCGSCTERLEAFDNNGIVDPIAYEREV